MCKYCERYTGKGNIRGKDFELEKTAGASDNDLMIHNAWIMKGENDERPGIMFSTHNTNAIYFDINYCPICGRKLVKNNIDMKETINYLKLMKNNIDFDSLGYVYGKEVIEEILYGFENASRELISRTSKLEEVIKDNVIRDRIEVNRKNE